jgi:hypothetical protein
MRWKWESYLQWLEDNYLDVVVNTYRKIHDQFALTNSEKPRVPQDTTSELAAGTFCIQLPAVTCLLDLQQITHIVDVKQCPNSTEEICTLFGRNQHFQTRHCYFVSATGFDIPFSYSRGPGSISGQSMWIWCGQNASIQS